MLGLVQLLAQAGNCTSPVWQTEGFVSRRSQTSALVGDLYENSRFYRSFWRTIPL
jgi:hypothetical protein